MAPKPPYLRATRSYYWHPHYVGLLRCDSIPPAVSLHSAMQPSTLPVVCCSLLLHRRLYVRFHTTQIETSESKPLIASSYPGTAAAAAESDRRK